MTKTIDLQKRIEEIKSSNQKKIDAEISKTIADFKHNSLQVNDDSKSGSINLKLTTNKRSLLYGASAIALLSAATIVAVKQIKKINNKKKIEDKNIITPQIDRHCEN